MARSPRTPLGAEEKVRGKAGLTPYVAQQLLVNGRFRVSTDTPEIVGIQPA